MTSNGLPRRRTDIAEGRRTAVSRLVTHGPEVSFRAV